MEVKGLRPDIRMKSKLVPKLLFHMLRENTIFYAQTFLFFFPYFPFFGLFFYVCMYMYIHIDYNS